jgi:hypothetical protein
MNAMKPCGRKNKFSTHIVIMGRKCARATFGKESWILHCRWQNVTLSLVKSVGKFAVLLLALSLFASPLMACLLPNSSLTGEERECCRQMAGKCDEMPSSHSCCKTTVRDTDPYLSNSRVQISAPAQATLAILPVSEIIGLPDLISQFVISSDSHAPPESPPVKSSILRI